MFNNQENRPLSAQQQAPIDLSRMASVHLSLAAWNVVRAGLWELPAKIAVPLIKELETQLASQPSAAAQAPNNLEAFAHE